MSQDKSTFKQSLKTLILISISLSLLSCGGGGSTSNSTNPETGTADLWDEFNWGNGNWS